MILKIGVCIVGHSSVIVRNQYYPHPEEMKISYIWIQFYFIEVLTFIPSTIFLVYQAIMEAEQLPSLPKRPTTEAMQSAYSNYKNKDGQEKPSDVKEEETVDKKPLIDRMSKKQFLEKRILIPFYMELLQRDTEYNAEKM